MTPVDADALRRLEELRGNPAVVYQGRIDRQAPELLYELLRTRGQVPKLDLVLATTGGQVTAARRLALLLREFAKHLTVLVAYRARSAGTLLALAADELVLGPLAELGPLDAQFQSDGVTPPGAPGIISAEDVRAFSRLAEDWFGVARQEDRLQVLALVAQRIFPTTLAAFYRADRLTREVTGELLAQHLPDADEAARAALVDRMVSGYHDHDYPITRADARRLGLRVTYASAQEEAILWELRRECELRCDAAHADACIGTGGPAASWRLLGAGGGPAEAQPCGRADP